MKTIRTLFHGSAAVVFLGLVLVAAGLFGVIATGCSDSEESAVNETRSYTVTARVMTVPEAGNPGSEFQVHHEHIPDFHGEDGNVKVDKSGVRGMKPHIMAFPLGPGVDVSELKPSDMIELVFVVNWSRQPHYYVTDFTILDPGTALNTHLIEPAEEDTPTDEDAPIDDDG